MNCHVAHVAIIRYRVIERLSAVECPISVLRSLKHAFTPRFRDDHQNRISCNQVMYIQKNIMQSGYVYPEEYHNSIHFDFTSAGKVACRILDVQLDNMEAQ